MIVIIKKEVYKDLVSMKTIKRIPGIIYPLMKWFYEIRGYEVESLESDKE